MYADNKKVGSVAAPTAGFHFTKELIKKLKKKGVRFEYVTLHVGWGTFAPVKANNITKHKMHAEWVEVKSGALKKIIKAKKDKRRIIAVGTTSVRALETIFNQIKKSCELRVMSCELCDFSGWTNIFIYPGYKFKVIDGLVTNFHLPKSTLLMLVCVFSDQKKIFKAYREAIKKKYRFYSYGDAMLIM